jgi:hypothetical protein
MASPTEAIDRHAPYSSFEIVEFAVVELVDRFNHGRLLEPIGRFRRRGRGTILRGSGRWATVRVIYEHVLDKAGAVEGEMMAIDMGSCGA